MTRFRGDWQASPEIAERGRACRPRGSVPPEEADLSSAITAPPVPPTIKFAAMTAHNPSGLVLSVKGFALGTVRRSRQAVKPPSQFHGKNMALKTFVDKMRSCNSVNGWSDEASLLHLTNLIQDPDRCSFGVLIKKIGYSFDDVFRALEATHGISGLKDNRRAELSSCRGRKGQSFQELGPAMPRLMCLIYPEAWTDATEKIDMRAFFDALEDVEKLTQCRYQEPKTHRAAIVMAKTMELDETPLTLNVVVMAFHTAIAPQPPTPAVPATTVPKGPSRDPGGNRNQVNNLHDGLRKQAVDIERRFTQMADQLVNLAGSIKRIDGLLRPAPTAPETWCGSAGAGGL